MSARRSAATIESGYAAIYGGNSFGAFNLRAGAAYAHHRIDTTRSILFPGFADRATANYDGGTGQVFGEIGYGFALGSVAIEPFAGLAWVQARTNRSPKPAGPRRSRVRATPNSPVPPPLARASPPRSRS